MEKRTTGTVVSVRKQWWLKINTRPIRTGPLDGAVFPHVIKIAYTVDGTEYVKRKWIGAGEPVPPAGSTVALIYDEDRPEKIRLA